MPTKQSRFDATWCGRMVTLAVVALLAGLVAGCMRPSAGDDADDLRVGPWIEESAPQTFTLESDPRTTQRIKVTNLLGSVSIRESEDGRSVVTVIPRNGKLPKSLMWAKASDGADEFLVLDSQDAMNDRRPECPVERVDGGIERLGYRLPRVDVVILLASHADVDINACSMVLVNADCEMRARCGTVAKLESGHGSARIEAPRVEAGSCSFAVTAAVSKAANFSGTIGDKRIRGTGDVVITGGSGCLDIFVGGKVFVDAPIVGGYAPVAVVSGPGVEDIGMIGPGSPFSQSRQPNRDMTMSMSRIAAEEVEVRMPVTCQLEVRMKVEHGQAEVFLPVGDRRVVPHVMTNASVHFSVGAPKGELVIEAVRKGEIIIKPMDPTLR